MSGNEEFPRVPRTRLNVFWNGVKGAVEPRLTIVLTFMVAVVMFVQAATLVWAINVSRQAQEARVAELTAILDQLHSIAVENETESQSHRCRSEQLWREHLRLHGQPIPPYPPEAHPPKQCNLDEGHP